MKNEIGRERIQYLRLDWMKCNFKKSQMKINSNTQAEENELKES